MNTQSKKSAGTAKLLRSFFEATAPSIGNDFFRALVRHMATTLEVRQAFISEVTEDPLTARTLAVWFDGNFIDNVEYALPGTPCELVLKGDIIQIPNNFRKQYPGDKGLLGMPVESYLGVPMIGESGKILGHVVAMNDKPMVEKYRDFSTFEIFAARATAELERRRIDQALRHRIEMEKLLAKISTNFINISADQIDKAIESALSQIGQFSKVDRSYVFLFSEDRRTISNTHEWCSKGIDSRREQLQKISTDEINWLIDKLQRNEVTHIPNLNFLPKEAGDLKEYFQSEGIRSFLEVPLYSGNQLIGILGFNTSRFEKKWSEDDIRILKIASETFVNALERKRADKILKKAQAQLIQSEKLASLGKMTAGIAHEVNNPVGAIKSTLDNSKRYIENIRKALAGGDSPNSQLQKSLDALNNNFGVMTSASDRITSMVTNLRKFVGLDEAEYQRVNVHEKIDSTLMLIQNELSNRIRVVKKYGDIPEIFGYPKELNQAFMNVITNAIDSIEDKGKITINTSSVDDTIRIEISDTGKGIQPDKLSSLFDFNFTTKSDRIGVGMGLMSAYNIIQKHKGEMEIKSEVGKGTIVTITLPIK